MIRHYQTSLRNSSVTRDCEETLYTNSSSSGSSKSDFNWPQNIPEQCAEHSRSGNCVSNKYFSYSRQSVGKTQRETLMEREVLEPAPWSRKKADSFQLERRTSKQAEHRTRRWPEIHATREYTLTSAGGDDFINCSSRRKTEQSSEIAALELEQEFVSLRQTPHDSPTITRHYFDRELPPSPSIAVSARSPKHSVYSAPYTAARTPTRRAQLQANLHES